MTLLLIAASDDACIVPFVALIAIGIVGFAIWQMVQSRDRMRATVARAVAPYQGTVEEGGWAVSDSAVLTIEGVPSRLSWHAGSRNNPAHTMLEFHLSSPGLLRVRKEGFLGAIRKLFGAQDIEVGDACFDGAYQVEATPAEFARQILTPAVIKAFSDAYGMDPSLDVQRQRVSLRVAKCIADTEESLAWLLGFGKLLVLSLQGQGPVAGVTIEAVSTSEGDCPTCGAPLAGAAVAACGKCGGKQHVECWDYVGICATYACGGRRATR
jgi:hypothetical protein